MSSAGPWSVKGIDPKAREIAKDLARRSGMTLGEWLNQMIIEGEPEGQPSANPFAARDYPPPPPPEPARPVLQAPRGQGDDAHRIASALEAFSSRLEAAEHRSTLAISGIDQSVMGVLSRMEGIERDQTAIGARFEGSVDEVRMAQQRLAERLRRMEADDGPRTEAMKAMEASLGKVAAQVYEGESRARGSIAEVRQDLSGLSRRLDRLDVEVAGKADAGDPYTSASMVDTVVARVIERVEQAENRTSAAMQALEASFAGLDARLKTTETRLDPEVEEDTPERRFQRLAAELQEKVEAQRAEIAEHMRAAADGKLDRMESALRDLVGHVESSEKRSAQAIERMGREVMRIAQTLGQRVAAVETRNAEADEQVGGEMARIADAIENRMRAADSAQAEALEKLGGEIGRIAERLAERIAASERRAATAIDEVGDQVARVTDKINQRYDRAASELSERIRQSEERTAKLLEEARETLDRRLIDTQRRNAIDAAVQAVEAPAARIADFDGDGDGFSDGPYVPGEFGAAANPGFNDDPFSPAEPQRFERQGFEEPRFESPAFEPEADDEPAAFDGPAPGPTQGSAFRPGGPEAFDQFDPPPQMQPARSSTRDLIEAARAAARQANAPEARGRRSRGDDLAGSAPAPLDDEAPRGLGAFMAKRKKKKETNTLRTALLASGTAATLSMAAVGYQMLSAGSGDHGQDARPATPAVGATAAPQTSDADLLAAALTSDQQPAAAPAPAAPAAPKPAPAPAAPAADAAPAVAATAAPAADPKQLYSNAVLKIEGGDTTGVDALRRAANLGYAPAQFYLAKLHESGSAGVKKDPVEARRWTERAAAGGDNKAMHNLGLYYFEGTGGAKNVTQAAAWFRKAADAGLKDSQYNLARLYELGQGVAANPAEAYKWYLIAAAGGDSEARSSAERLRAQLPAETRTVSERSAAGFRSQTPAVAQR
jgi:localization factor PodJL